MSASGPSGPLVFLTIFTSILSLICGRGSDGKYLFVIFYLCVVMFFNLGHQLAKGETCGDGRRGNAQYKTEVDHQTYFP